MDHRHRTANYFNFDFQVGLKTGLAGRRFQAPGPAGSASEKTKLLPNHFQQRRCLSEQRASGPAFVLFFILKMYTTMKISKSLLQAILVGVTVSATLPACETIKENNELEITNDNSPRISHPINENPGNENPTCFECPACGMG